MCIKKKQEWSLFIHPHQLSRTSIIVTLCGVIESFSNGDGDGNEDVQRAIGLLRKSTTLHVHQGFFFSAVPAQLRLLISFLFGGRQQATTYFFSLETFLSSKLKCGPHCNQLQRNSPSFDVFDIFRELD